MSNDLTYRGVQIVGRPISFHNSSRNVSYLWYFGDGATSTVADPSHTYSSVGIYTVTLTINGDAAHAVNKKIKISTDPLYTHLVGGTRLWRRIKTQGNSSWDTTINYSDTLFAVNVLDPVTLSIGGKTLSYANTSFYNDIVLAFLGTDGLYLDFFLSKDSIHLEQHVNWSQGWHVTLHSYTK